MILRIIDTRLIALAVLSLALLGNALHAAEHGVGEHDHEGVPCLVGAANEDDVLASPPSAVSFPTNPRSAVKVSAELIVELAEAGVQLPPATGPPTSV